MDLNAGLQFAGTPLKIIFINLLLSGDNAVVIALACRSLPPRHMRRAIFIGTVLAILFRVVNTSIIAFLLEAPYLQLAGALALIVIAVKLMASESEPSELESAQVKQELDLWSAVGVIAVADAIMSLDNVVAIAAVAQGNFFYLVLGLAISIPLLIYGSVIIAGVLNLYPALITAGGALLGWIAGDIGVSDPAIAGWVRTEAPALAVVMPVIGVVFVVLESRIVRQEAPLLTAARRSLHRPRTAPAASSPTPARGMAAAAPAPDAAALPRPAAAPPVAGTPLALPFRRLHLDRRSALGYGAIALGVAAIGISGVYLAGRLFAVEAPKAPDHALSPKDRLCDERAREARLTGKRETVQWVIDNCMNDGN